MTVFEKLAESEKRIAELEEENKRLHNTVAYLTNKRFGRSSEKTAALSIGQPSLFDEDALVFNEAENTADPKQAEPTISKEEDKPKSKKYKGQRDFLLKDLPHVKKVISFSEADRICQTCGNELLAIGEEFVRSELEYIPAKLQVIDYYRESLECRTCRKNGDTYIKKTSTPAPVILHSMASPSAIAWMLHQKFVNALPLNRQEKEWQSLGIDLKRATMANWILAVARDWLMPIVELLQQELLRETWMHVDETAVQVLQEKGRKNTTKSYMWLYAAGQYADHAIRLFEYQPGRSGEYPMKFLNGFKGYLHTDAYAGYNKVSDVVHCYCWAHLRRKFVDALPTDTEQREKSPATKGIAFCNKLFEIESALQDLSCEERKTKRLELEMPVLEAFWSWVDTAKNHEPPKSAICGALNYAQNHKEGLMNYLLDSKCAISNNLAENSIRPFTIGRKNWLFSGSPKGAAASAAVYSLIETAKANGLNPQRYLRLLLESLPDLPFRQHPDLLKSYLPWNEEIQANCK